MASALLMKSFRDLSKKKVRTIFTIITIALGVMGMGLFAVSPLADRGVLDQIDQANMANVEIDVKDVNLTETNLQELEGLDNVDLIEAKVIYLSKVKIGNRWDNAIVLGIIDFEDQKVDKVDKTTGSNPGNFQALTEKGNSINGIKDWKNGATVVLKDSTGAERELAITGEGSSLGLMGATTQGFAVFYTTVDSVRELGHLSGYNRISFVLEDTDEEPMEKTIEDIRAYLTDPNELDDPVVAFSNLPETRAEGEWPGKEFLDQMMSFMYILTFLALFSSVFLISNTMNTIISEQKKEIAQMKAIGASKKQVFRSFLTTSVILGLIGAAIGAILGMFVSYFVLNSMGATFGFSLPFDIHYQTVLVSFGAGIGVVIAASMPALIRSSRVVIREGLESSGISATYGKGGMDKLLMRAKGLPRPIQMGLRNVARKKGRSAVTVIQVAIAVGVFLGLITFTYSLSIAVEGAWDDLTWDIAVGNQGGGAKTMTDDVEIGILDNFTEEIESMEPFLLSNAQIGERNIQIWGYIHDTKAWDYQGTMTEGRWFEEDDHLNNEKYIVIGEALAEFEDIDVGDTIPVMTATGEEDFTVIGLQSSLMDNGQAVMAPMSTMQDVLQTNDISGFFINTQSFDHDDIDQFSTDIEEYLRDEGYSVVNQIHYVMKERNQAQNAGMMNLFLIVSLIIVFISMIGLMSTLTMGILERTREIGMMRCIGSRAQDVRRVFGTEGLFLALFGWVIGIPSGYILGNFIADSVAGSMNLYMSYYFPMIYLLVSFLIAMIGTAVIIQPPLLRATRLKPGDALRYQ